MGFGKVIRNPVKLIRKKLLTATSTERYFTKEDLYKDVDGTSVASEEEITADIKCANSTTTDTISNSLPQQEKKKDSIIDYGYEDASPTLSRSLACSELAMRTPRRSSLRTSESTLRRRASISYRGEVTFILPNGKQAKKRTSISFEEKENQTKEVKPILDMVDNPNRLWFQEEEYVNIKKEIVRILQNESQSIPSKLDCTRGLEQILCESAKEAREQANTSVLEEYSMQQNRGEYNGDSLRQIYSFYTIDSQVEAADRADRDRQEVENYLEDTRKLWRRRSC